MFGFPSKTAEKVYQPKWMIFSPWRQTRAALYNGLAEHGSFPAHLLHIKHYYAYWELRITTIIINGISLKVEGLR